MKVKAICTHCEKRQTTEEKTESCEKEFNNDCNCELCTRGNPQEKETLTIEQTDKILKKLKDYGFEVTEPAENGYGVNIISEEYFNEKLNEALEENN